LESEGLKIRAKTTLVLGIVMLSLAVTACAVAYTSTSNNIEVTEKEDSTFNVKRFIDNLNIDLSSVENTVSDLGTWDDTYRFIEDNSTAYAESNLLDQTFTDLRLNLIVYFNQEDQIVWGETFSNQTSTATYKVTLNQIASYKSLFIADPDAEKSGLIILDGTPVLIATHPVPTSEHGRPAHATLMMGRNLDQPELGILSTAVGLPLSITLIGDPKMEAN
jgi:sensor domain CHASE-containing protein